MSPELWTAYWAFVSFVFGAVAGSFLNACIWRLPRGESMATAPSHCIACGHRLRFFPDMVPLGSALWFRARCRYCGEKFGWRYFWVELVTAVLFTAIYLRYVPFASGVFLTEETRNLLATLAMGYVAALLLAFFIDLEHYQIPDVAVLAAVLFAVAKDGVLIYHKARPLFQTIPGTPWSVPLPLSILGGLLAFWFLWQFAALTTAALGREAMGAGDSLLLAAMGAFLIPWPLLVLAFMVAVLLGTVGGLVGMWLARPEPETASAVSPGQVVSEPPNPQADAPAPGAAESSAAASEQSPEQAGGGESSAEAVGARGMTEGPADEGPEAPELPPSSRWGRLLTVLGTWVALAAVWGGAVLGVRNPGLGIGVGLALALAAAGMLWYGVRVWVRGDQEWLPAMDELFEGDPGPRFIPFGPYLVAGTVVAMLFGRPLIEAYWKWMMLPPLALPWD